MNLNKFSYQSYEMKNHNGVTKIRKVNIKNGKGYKSVTIKHKGQRPITHSKRIKHCHVRTIKNGKFIPRFFLDCKKRNTNTRRNKNQMK